jgi:hypothetical protein
MAISVTTTNETITAAVTDEQVTATVSPGSAVSATVTAGFGATGPAGAPGATTWNDIAGKPATFPPATHQHVVGDVTGLQAALDGKQVAGSYAAAVHSHGISDVTGLQTALDGKAATSHGHAIADVTGLQSALDGKQASGSYAAAVHAHSWSDITSGVPSTFAPPVATSSVLGGVKQGSNVTIGVDGTISVAAPFSGSYSDLTGRPTLGSAAAAASTDFAAASHAHGSITNAGAIGSTSGLIVVTTTAGALTTAASISTSQITGLGTLATQSGTFSGTSSGTNTGDQTITLTGDVTGSGTGSFAATLASTGVSAGTYTSVTVDAKGRVTAGSSPAVAYSALSGVPSTFVPSAHTHPLSELSQSGATTNQVPQWNGSAWVPATVSSGSSSASDLTSGTLADARLSDKARAAANVYLWSNFR